MSSSLLTNNAAMTALLSLNQTQQNLATYENQVSTGLKISSAADNATYWSIATTMNSQISGLGAVSNALSESASMLSTTTAALQSTISIMDQIGANLVTAEASGADLSKIQTTIGTLQQQLITYGTSAAFNGQNLLATATGQTVNLVASYDTTNGVSFITLNTTNTALFATGVGGTANLSGGSGILDSNGTASQSSILDMSLTNFNGTGVAATSGDIANLITDVNTALASIETAASTLGATQTSVTDQQNFISNLSDSLTSGVGAMVDADMNQASTKISALQVQQELGVQALAIANSNTQMILRLFQ